MDAAQQEFQQAEAELTAAIQDAMTKMKLCCESVSFLDPPQCRRFCNIVLPNPVPCEFACSRNR
jgi:hypothetical protein